MLQCRLTVEQAAHEIDEFGRSWKLLDVGKHL
jgi:hypothetical protein